MWCQFCKWQGNAFLMTFEIWTQTLTQLAANTDHWLLEEIYNYFIHETFHDFSHKTNCSLNHDTLPYFTNRRVHYINSKTVFYNNETVCYFKIIHYLNQFTIWKDPTQAIREVTTSVMSSCHWAEYDLLPPKNQCTFGSGDFYPLHS